MSNLALLIKNNIINETGINKLKNADKKEKSKAIGMGLLISVSMIILAVYGFVLCSYLSNFLIEINQMELLLVLGILGCTFATFFTSLYKASSYLFQSKDYEMLVSLPIKQSTILSSKVIMLIINNYLFGGVFILIPGIVYFIKMETSSYYLIFLIILTLVAPLIPILISSLVAFFISNISSRSKKSNIISIVLNLAIIVVVMVLSFNIQNVIMNLIQNSNSIIEASQKIYPLSYYFVDSLKNGNLISLIIFLLISLLPMAVFVYLFANNFNKVNSKMSETYKANNYKFKELKLSKPVIALFRKELKRYLSSTIYVMNSSIGMVLLPIFTVSIVLVGYDKISQILEMNYMMDMVLIQIIVFCIVMTNTACVSISLEGKNLWILKSSPIKEMDIFKSKILLNTILTIPISVISFVVLAIKLDFHIKSSVIIIITIILLSIFSATLGLFINLLFPKLNFTSDVAVVKQGASVIVNMICNLIYVVSICGIGYLFKINDINKFLIIGNLITVMGIFALYILLKTKGIKLFRNL